MSLNSSLYVGRVTHHRLRPRRHHLTYRAFWMLLDLDEVQKLERHLHLFSCKHFNLFGFRPADHGAGTIEQLRKTVEGHLTSAGLDADGGTIQLLTMPRFLGYVFNPLSIYFCHRKDGSLIALLYEVNNTFGERHSYLIASPKIHDGAIHQSCAKKFYVSPFLDMDMRYDFSVVEPDDTVRIVVRASDGDGELLVASLLGARKPLTDRSLLRLALTHPAMTFKVTLGIHWEALLLWLKGVRLKPKPHAPTNAVTVSPGSTVLKRST